MGKVVYNVDGVFGGHSFNLTLNMMPTCSRGLKYSNSSRDDFQAVTHSLPRWPEIIPSNYLFIVLEGLGSSTGRRLAI